MALDVSIYTIMTIVTHRNCCEKQCTTSLILKTYPYIYVLTTISFQLYTQVKQPDGKILQDRTFDLA